MNHHPGRRRCVVDCHASITDRRFDQLAGDSDVEEWGPKLVEKESEEPPPSANDDRQEFAKRDLFPPLLLSQPVLLFLSRPITQDPN